MLSTIFVILLILWILNLVSGYTIGGCAFLLVIAIVVALINIVSERKRSDGSIHVLNKC
jgi:DMSO reductase anchor subunit